MAFSFLFFSDSGIEKWPGYQIHSHNYRVSEQFRGQVGCCW